MDYTTASISPQEGKGAGYITSLIRRRDGGLHHPPREEGAGRASPPQSSAPLWFAPGGEGGLRHCTDLPLLPPEAIHRAVRLPAPGGRVCLELGWLKIAFRFEPTVLKAKPNVTDKSHYFVHTVMDGGKRTTASDYGLRQVSTNKKENKPYTGTI